MQVKQVQQAPEIGRLFLYAMNIDKVKSCAPMERSSVFIHQIFLTKRLKSTSS